MILSGPSEAEARRLTEGKSGDRVGTWVGAGQAEAGRHGQSSAVWGDRRSAGAVTAVRHGEVNR